MRRFNFTLLIDRLIATQSPAWLTFSMILLALCTGVSAQTDAAESDRRPGAWVASTRFTPIYAMNEKVSLMATFSTDNTLQNAVVEEYGIEPEVQYRLTPWLLFQSSVYFGYRIQGASGNYFEYRPALDIQPSIRVLGRVGLNYRARLEFRNIDYTDNGTSQDITRFRNRLQAIVPINGVGISEGIWYGLFDVEIFISTNGESLDHYNDQNRTRLGLAYRLSKELDAALIYENRGVKDPLSNNLKSRDSFLQLRVQYLFGQKN